jgi:hypothetical protein
MKRENAIGFPRGIAATVLLGGVCALAPSLASAATINADHTCFRPGQPALISGSGYTPGGEVALTFNVIGAHEDTTSSTLLVTADSAGAIALRVKTPRLPLLESPATVLLAATDQEQAAGGPPPLVSTRWRIATFNAFVFPWVVGTGDPHQRAQYVMSGFTTEASRTLFAHYIFKGKLYRTVPVGRLKGDCGEMFKRSRQFPFRRVPAGVWSIKVDTCRSYPNNSRGHFYRRVKVSKANALP